MRGLILFSEHTQFSSAALPPLPHRLLDMGGNAVCFAGYREDEQRSLALGRLTGRHAVIITYQLTVVSSASVVPAIPASAPAAELIGAASPRKRGRIRASPHGSVVRKG